MKTPKQSKSSNEKALANPEALYQELNLLKVEGVTFSFDPKASGLAGKPYEVMEYVNDPENKIRECPIVIEPHPKYGRPSPLAYKLLNVIFKKLSEYGLAVPNSVPFTFRELAKRLGFASFGGRDAKDVFRALKQIQTTFITAWAYNKTTQKWASVSFNIFTSVVASGTRGTFYEGYVGIAPLIIHNLERNYHRTINYSRLILLDPIQIALYKQIYNVFCTRFSHRQHATFEKNYDNICAEWLGGLRAYKHKSQILYKIGPHLDALKQTNLLRSYRVERNNSRGWKLIFNPGQGFYQDYENFYKAAKQQTLRFEYSKEVHEIQRPLDLVAYFYEQLYGNQESNSYPVLSPKETEFAKDILQRLEFEEAKQFVDFALAEAAGTGFDIKTFGGVRSYLPAWPKQKKKFESKQKREKKEKEQGLKDRYEDFRRATLSKFREQIAPEELSSIEREVEGQLENEGVEKIARGPLKRVRVNTILTERFKPPSFEEWKKSLGGKYGERSPTHVD
ncbi:MAG: hypothetical protein ACRD5H_03140, partial [Nitrososphaerales archaeon]